MKIVTFDSARVTWLFPLEEFAPSSGANPPAILAEIAERYGFKKIPQITTREDMAKNGLPFGVGQFDVDNTTVMISDFAIYNDGLAAAAERTEWAEAFLNDAYNWVIEHFGFRDPVSVRKLYGSNIVVDFERPISKLISGYERIIEILTARTVTIMHAAKPMQLSRLDFEVDKNEIADGQVVQPKFLLERRAGVPFSQQRFYSSAPMHTANHIEVLTEIEKLAAAL